MLGEPRPGREYVNAATKKMLMVGPGRCNSVYMIRVSVVNDVASMPALGFNPSHTFATQRDLSASALLLLPLSKLRIEFVTRMLPRPADGGKNQSSSVRSPQPQIHMHLHLHLLLLLLVLLLALLLVLLLPM